MRILVQRVSSAAVHVDGEEVGSIGRGLLLLVGMCEADTPAVLEPMARKVVNMRLFPDAEGKSHFDRSALEENAEILVVSQFTLYADCRKGRRPSFTDSCEPQRADRMIQEFVEILRQYPLKVATGRFGAMMDVSLVNQGPVTIWVDSEEQARSKK